MSVQDDEMAGRDSDRPSTDKKEPDEDHRQRAADMMQDYDDRPTLVLPGSGGTVAGTAVSEWLDEDGNPKSHGGDPGEIDEAKREQIEKDKALNVALTEAAAAENKGENR